jgi:hypothetical protein
VLAGLPKAKLIDWEIALVDYRVERLLMTPAFTARKPGVL